MPRVPSDLRKELELRKQFYSRAHAQMMEADRYHQQNFAGVVDVPNEAQVYKSATASNVVDGFRNQLRTDEPQVTFRPVGPSREADKQASRMARWGYSMLGKERLNSVIDPNLQCGYDLILRGASCKKIIVDVEKLGTNEWPFISRGLDPLTVFPATSFRRPMTSIIEVQERTTEDIWEDYPHWRDPRAKTLPRDEAESGSRKVTWLEYWSKERYVVDVDGERIIDKENPYGFVPYLFEWSGLGRRNYDNDPASLAIGVLTRRLGELAQEVKLKTAASVGAQMHVFPVVLTVDDPGKLASQFAVGPGKIIKHAPGQEPKYMTPPPLNDTVWRMLGEIQASLSPLIGTAVRGQNQAGVYSGIHEAILSGEGQEALRQVRATLDRIGSQTLDMMARMMFAMNVDMTVEGVEETGVEKPYRYQGSEFTHYNFQVTFEVVDPKENDRAMLVGQALRRAGDLTRRTFYKEFAPHIVRDPDDEIAELAAEAIFEQLLASGAITQLVLTEVGLQEQAQQVEDTAKKVKEQFGQQRKDMADLTNAQFQTEQLSGQPGIASESETIGRLAGVPSA